MPTRKKCRSLVYLRRSSGRQETSLETQLEWAIGEAAKQKIRLDASLEDLAEMKKRRISSFKDIRMDDSITGADLNRPGFIALNRDALENTAYSHVLIHKRDRYGRPEDALGMVATEKKLLLAGITIIFTDSVSEPMDRGRQYLEREFAMLFGYYESGAFLTKLAERVLEKQRLLALEGFRTGGNAPFGFVRVLVDANNRIVEELPPGRRIRQAGHHVRIQPKNDSTFRTRLYILDLRAKGWGFKRIAVHLNQLGIPSPDAGKTRTDHRVPHFVSGKWSHGTVREICKDPINVGMQEYGTRSEGAHRRLGQEGPRLLTDADRNAHDKPRTILNDKSTTIAKPTGTEPLLAGDRFAEMLRQIDERGKNQRGIPRTKDPARYPLSCRIMDLTDGCGAIMYGRMHSQRQIYACGRYMRTDGAECENNAVDGEALLRFTLKTLRQLIDRNGNRERLRQLLLKRATEGAAGLRVDPAGKENALWTAMVNELKSQQAIVSRRMALEKNDDRYTAIAGEFDGITRELQSAVKELEAIQRSNPPSTTRTPDEEVDAAMALLDDIRQITTAEKARTEINPLLKKLGLWIGLTFGSAIKGKKRVVRKLLSGLITFGGAGLPVPLHGSSNLQGPDGHCDQLATSDSEEDHSCQKGAIEGIGQVDVDGKTEKAGKSELALIPADFALHRNAQSDLGQPEGISFTKDSRGDWIRTSDLLNPINGIVATSRRRISQVQAF